MKHVLLLLAATTLSGCATLFGSHTAEFDFTSDPSGAQVLIDGQLAGTTPLEIQLSNHEPLVVTFRKEGYQDITCRLSLKTGAGWVILDVLGGLIPVIVDGVTGKWSQLPDHDCHVALTPETT